MSRTRIVKFRGPRDPLRGKRGHISFTVNLDSHPADDPEIVAALLRRASDSMTELYGYRVEPKEIAYKWMPEHREQSEALAV